MDLVEVMRTTFACREFQDEEIEDEVIHRILDNARFAPSGGNRQGVHVIVVKDSEKKRKLGQLCGTPLLLYAAQQEAGEVPFKEVRIPGDGHYSEYGHTVVANNIYRLIND